MTRYRCLVAYDGTDFHGWQSQACGMAIQDILEKRLATITREQVRVHGSGRTDSGVHAKAQCFHFDSRWNYPPETLLRALRNLPSGISVYKAVKAKNGFHARFSAKGKRYCYHIYQGFPPPFEARYCWGVGEQRLDVPAMQKAAALLLGEHDFSAFGATHASAERENPIKHLRRLDVVVRGKKILITTEAGGYLYKMVRRLVGGLVRVGLGKWTPEDLLAYREKKICDAQITTAPARGLFMEKVFY
ncbi:MAG: tRNA pseudouridine(38-40) synthase TruA [Opitutales bacterium]|nr:tRNA pseudouridine(38-40) synthase TruA [Opitutales bacterium]